MQILDLVILIFTGILMILGFRKGFIISLATLVALILGLYLAIRFSFWTSGLIQKYLEVSPGYLPVISFIVTFILVLIGVLVIGKMVEKLVDLAGIGFLNHLAGLILGFIKATLILSLVFYILLIVDPKEKLITPKAKNESVFYELVSGVIPALLKYGGIDHKVFMESDRLQTFP